MNVFYDKENPSNSVVSWKGKPACCLTVLFVLAMLGVGYYYFIILGDLKLTETIDGVVLPKRPTDWDYTVKGLLSDYDLGKM